MVGLREMVTVRLEIDFEVLAGELQTIEEDSKRMPLSKLVEVWSPERRNSRLMLKVVDIEEKVNERKKAKKILSPANNG